MANPAAPHPCLTPEALAVLYDHARRDYPHECCGIVYGPRDATTADRATPCENIQDRLHALDPVQHSRDASRAYSLGTSDLVAMQKSLRGDTPAKIIYHSHVNVGAYFSETDQTAALFAGEPAYPVDYVVIDIAAAGPRGAKQFTWSEADGKYVEIGDYSA